MTPVKLSDFAQWDWKGSLMWWFWWKSTYSRCHSKMLSRFPKIIRSFPSLRSSGILRIVGKVKLWAKEKVEPDISLLGLLAITHVGDIGRRLLKVRHIHKLGLQQLLKFGSVVKELQFFILTYSYFIDISPKVWNGLLTCWEEGIIEEYQNHFIRHLPILSVTCPSHPSLAHLIRRLPISSVTRHLSVEKKGFIG